MRKKRSFLLLELLIALTLVMLLSTYLIRGPMDQLKGEVDALVELEGERLWLVYLMELRQKMGRDCVFDAKVVKKLPLSIPGVDFHKSVVKEYRITQKMKPGEDENDYFLLKVEEKDRYYNFFVAMPKK